MSLTRRGRNVVAGGVVIGLFVAPGLASMLGTALTGVPDNPPTSTGTTLDGEDQPLVPVEQPSVRPSPPRVEPKTVSRSRLATVDPTVASGSPLSSTAYCETGLMANGQHTRRGVAAGNRWKLGTVLHVSDSPYGPGDFTVLDRIGHGSDLDFAMPGDCDGARQWGRRTITAEVVR